MLAGCFGKNGNKFPKKKQFHFLNTIGRIYSIYRKITGPLINNNTPGVCVCVCQYFVTFSVEHWPITFRVLVVVGGCFVYYYLLCLALLIWRLFSDGWWRRQWWWRDWWRVTVLFEFDRHDETIDLIMARKREKRKIHHKYNSRRHSDINAPIDTPPYILLKKKIQNICYITFNFDSCSCLNLSNHVTIVILLLFCCQFHQINAQSMSIQSNKKK